MKTAICALVVLAVVTAGAFLNGYFLSKKAEKLADATERILPAATAGEDCRAAMANLHNEWKACSFFFHLTVSHAEFDRLEEELERAVAAAEIGENEMLYMAASALADMFKHLGELTSVRIENIM